MVWVANAWHQTPSRPDLNLTVLMVTGNTAGAIVAIWVVAIGMIGIPAPRLFFLASGALGILLGLALSVEVPLMRFE